MNNLSDQLYFRYAPANNREFHYVKIKSNILVIAFIASIPAATYEYTPNNNVQDPTNNHYFLIENADFIVSGVVKKIQYESFSEENNKPIPTTLVTYKVDRVFHGNIVANNFIRLRFAGGPLEDGSVLQIPTLPKFEQGDYDVLFVSGNGEGPCPLVMCLEERIRVHDGYLFNEAISLEKVALTFDGATLYPAVEPIIIGDIHNFDQYSSKLNDVIASGQLNLTVSRAIVLDARTVKFNSPSN